MLTCVACGTENTADARFCKHCGAAMTPTSLEVEGRKAEETDAFVAANTTPPEVSAPPVAPTTAETKPPIEAARAPAEPNPTGGPPLIGAPLVGYAPVYARPPKDRGIALILEILPGLFGLFGFGWIYSGQTAVGLIWLFGVLVWDVIAIILVTISVGFACFCTIPVNLGLLILSSLLLHSHTKQHGELFGA